MEICLCSCFQTRRCKAVQLEFMHEDKPKRKLAQPFQPCPKIQLPCLPRSGKSTGRRLALLSRGMGTGNTKLGRKGQQRWERTKMSFPFTNETVQNLWPFPTMRASYFNFAAACKSLQSAANCGESKHQHCLRCLPDTLRKSPWSPASQVQKKLKGRTT